MSNCRGARWAVLRASAPRVGVAAAMLDNQILKGPEIVGAPFPDTFRLGPS